MSTTELEIRPSTVVQSGAPQLEAGGSLTIQPAQRDTFDPEVAVQNAWIAHLQKLKPEERAEFERQGSSDVMERLAEISQLFDDQNQKSKALKVSNFLQPLADTLNMYMPGALQIAQVYPNPALLIMGGVVTVLHLHKNFQSLIKQTVRRLNDMTKRLNIVRRITNQIFKQDSSLQLALTDLYGDVLDYCARVFRVVHRKGKPRGKFATFVTSLHKPSESQDDDVEENFRSHYEVFHELLKVYDRDQNQASHQDAAQTLNVIRQMDHTQQSGFSELMSNDQAILDHLFTTDRTAQIEKRANLKRKIRTWLQCVEYKDFYDGLLRERLTDTGQWLLEHETFESWRSTEQTSTLWLSAQAGSGKTFLAAIAIDSLKTDQSLDTAVVYHFFRRSEPETCRLDRLLASLLHQLLQQAPGLNRHVRNLYALATQSLNSLKDAIAGQMEDFSTVYLVADGLDECDKQEEFMDLLQDLVQLSLVVDVSFKILAVSREGYTRLESKLQHADFHIAIEPHMNKQDMELFIDQTITFDSLKKSLGTNNENQADLQNAQSTLLERSDGRFLYVRLMKDSLTRARSRSALQDLLDTLPAELNESYEKLLGQLEDKWNADDRKLAHKLILYTYWSLRPMNTKEMLTAIAMEPTTETLDPKQIGGDISDALELCGNLIKLNTEDCFVLCHSSFGDYLDLAQRTWINPFPYNDKVETLRLVKEIDCLAFLCIQYLCLKNFETVAFNTLSKPHQVLDPRYPMLEYAVYYWHKHVRRVPFDIVRDRILRVVQRSSARALCMSTFQAFGGPSSMETLIMIPESNALHLLTAMNYGELIPDVKVDKAALLQPDEVGRRPCDYAMIAANEELCLQFLKLAEEHGLPADFLSSKNSFFSVCAAYGLENLLEAVNSSPNISEDQVEINQALILTCERGDAKMAERLLEIGADPTKPNNSGQFAFLTAVRNGHRSLWDLFQSRPDFNVNVTESDGTAAIHIAVENKDTEGVRQLLAWGANPSAALPHRSNIQPIHLAARKDCDDIVRLLRDSGQDLTATDNKGFPPTFYAAGWGSLKALKELLASPSVRIDACTDKRLTLFHQAASWGHSEILEFLHTCEGSETLKDQADASGRTPLYHAVSASSPRALTTLLEYNIRPDEIATAEKHRTALNHALSLRRVDMAQLLIQKGADVTIPGNFGCQALHYAADLGLSSLIAPIVQAGGRIDALNDRQETVLHCACRSKSDELAIRLCDDYEGLDLTAVDHNGDSILHFAASFGLTEFTQYLVRKGISPNVPNAGGEYPIHTAILGGSSGAALVLLAASEDEYERLDQDEQAPLQIAVSKGLEDVIKQLVTKADVNRLDSFGSTPLVSALLLKYFSIAQILIDGGADVSKTDVDGISPLLATAWAERPDWIEKLLNLGSDAKVSDKNGTFPLDAALATGNERSVALLSELDPEGFTRVAPNGSIAAHLACIGANVDLVRFTITKNPSLSFESSDIYDDQGNGLMRNALWENSPSEILSYLISIGVTVNSADKWDHNQLFYVASRRRQDLMSLLLEYTNTDLVDQTSKLLEATALTIAAKFAAPKCAEMLLRAGADPYIVDVFGLCAFDYAERVDGLGKLMRRYGPQHLPLTNQARIIYMRRTISKLANELCSADNQEAWEKAYAETYQLSIITECLKCLKDEAKLEDKVCLYTALIVPPLGQSRMFEYTCELCGATNFDGNLYVCTQCPRELCGKCMVDFRKASFKAPDSIRQFERIEKSIRFFARSIQSLEADELFLVTHLFRDQTYAMDWMRSHKNAYEDWSQAYGGPEGKHKGLKSSGRDLMPILVDAFEDDYHVDDKSLTAEKLEQKNNIRQRFEAWKKHAVFPEVQVFGCDGHSFLGIGERDIDRVRVDRQIFDEEGRLERSWLRELAQRYAVDEAEIDDEQYGLQRDSDGRIRCQKLESTGTGVWQAPKDNIEEINLTWYDKSHNPEDVPNLELKEHVWVVEYETPFYTAEEYAEKGSSRRLRVRATTPVEDKICREIPVYHRLSCAFWPSVAANILQVIGSEENEQKEPESEKGVADRVLDWSQGFLSSMASGDESMVSLNTWSSLYM